MTRSYPPVRSWASPVSGVLRPTSWAALLVLLLAGRGDAGPLTASIRRTDQRLKRTVSVKADRIYVGDLVAALAQQSGVSIACSEDDGAADDIVAVSFKGVPVADAMDSLWSLLSYREAEWQWKRTGKPERYSYRLERPLAARQLPLRLQAETEASFEQQTERLIAAALLPTPDLEELARRDREAAMLVQSPRMRAGLRTVAEVLTPEQWRQAVRGGAEFEIPVTRLSQTGRAFVHSVWSSTKALRKGADGVFEPVPEPSTLTIRRDRLGNNLAPVLFIDLEGIGAYGYSGGMPLQRDWLARLKELWRLPGDQNANELEERLIPVPREAVPPLSSRWVQSTRLRQAADGTEVSFLARLSQDQRHDIGAPYGGSLGRYLARVRGSNPYLDHKWRGSILLVSYPAWYMIDTDAVKPSWAVARDLRRVEKASGGVLPVSAMDMAASRLNTAQVERLSADFPVMKGVALWHEFFAFRGRFPHLAREMEGRGMLLRDLRRLLPVPCSERVNQLLERDGAETVRLEIQDYLTEPKPAREVRFRVLSADGQTVGIGGLRFNLPAAKEEQSPPR